MTPNYRKAGWIMMGAAAGAGGAYMAWRHWRRTHVNEQMMDEMHTDRVDIAGAESFPASDPPSFTASRASN